MKLSPRVQEDDQNCYKRTETYCLLEAKWLSRRTEKVVPSHLVPTEIPGIYFAFEKQGESVQLTNYASSSLHRGGANCVNMNSVGSL